MAKAIKKKAAKKRTSNYEKPVIFNGTFEDMIAISATGAGVKKKNTDLKIEPYQIGNFLQQEHQYAFDPSNKDISTTVYSRRGFPSVSVPVEGTFTESAIVGKILSKAMFNQLIKFIEKNY